MLKGRNLLEPMDFTVEELEQLFHLADQIIENPERYKKACEGKLLATLFYEPSTRTRFSFEAAMLRLGKGRKHRGYRKDCGMLRGSCGNKASEGRRSKGSRSLYRYAGDQCGGRRSSASDPDTHRPFDDLEGKGRIRQSDRRSLRRFKIRENGPFPDQSVIQI